MVFDYLLVQNPTASNENKAQSLAEKSLKLACQYELNASQIEMLLFIGLSWAKKLQKQSCWNMNGDLALRYAMLAQETLKDYKNVPEALASTLQKFLNILYQRGLVIRCAENINEFLLVWRRMLSSADTLHALTFELKKWLPPLEQLLFSTEHRVQVSSVLEDLDVSNHVLRILRIEIPRANDVALLEAFWPLFMRLCVVYKNVGQYKVLTDFREGLRDYWLYPSCFTEKAKEVRLHLISFLCKEFIHEISEDTLLNLASSFWKDVGKKFKSHRSSMLAAADLNQAVWDETKLFLTFLDKKIKDYLGEPPCKYALLAMGSLARKEASPYSDLEYAIVMEEKSVDQTVSLASNNGVTCQRVPGDGHCLFHAVGHSVDETQEILRKRVAEHIQENPEVYPGVIEGIEIVSDRSIDGYINAFREGTESSEKLVISVLMKVLNRPIVIMGPDGKIQNPGDVNSYPGEPIFVYHNGDHHYDSLLLTDHYKNRGREVLASLIEFCEHAHHEKHYFQSYAILLRLLVINIGETEGYGKNKGFYIDPGSDPSQLNHLIGTKEGLLRTLKTLESSEGLSHSLLVAQPLLGDETLGISYQKSMAEVVNGQGKAFAMMMSIGKKKDSGAGHFDFLEERFIALSQEIADVQSIDLKEMFLAPLHYIVSDLLYCQGLPEGAVWPATLQEQLNYLAIGDEIKTKLLETFRQVQTLRMQLHRKHQTKLDIMDKTHEGFETIFEAIHEAHALLYQLLVKSVAPIWQGVSNTWPNHLDAMTDIMHFDYEPKYEALIRLRQWIRQTFYFSVACEESREGDDSLLNFYAAYARYPKEQKPGLLKVLRWMNKALSGGANWLETLPVNTALEKIVLPSGLGEASGDEQGDAAIDLWWWLIQNGVAEAKVLARLLSLSQASLINLRHPDTQQTGLSDAMQRNHPGLFLALVNLGAGRLEPGGDLLDFVKRHGVLFEEDDLVKQLSKVNRAFGLGIAKYYLLEGSRALDGGRLRDLAGNELVWKQGVAFGNANLNNELKRHENAYGRRRVLEASDKEQHYHVHLKISPEIPGLELAVQSLAGLLDAQDVVAASDVYLGEQGLGQSVERRALQLSQHVAGENLWAVLENP
ncbi:MAG: DUF294 nucleotidyltransferase-like domain-containing protein, partial [Candidatus Berkiella sp.]